MGHAPTDLIEGFFQIGRYGEDVPHVTQRHLFAQIHAHLKIIGGVECRNTPDTLRAKARTGTVSRAAIKRHS